MITYSSLLQEVKDTYSFNYNQWNEKIKQHGIDHVDDINLAKFIDSVANNLNKIQEEQISLNLRKPNTNQMLGIHSVISENRAKLTSLKYNKSNVTSAVLVGGKLKPSPIVRTKKELTDSVDSVNKLIEYNKLLNIPNKIEKNEKTISSLKEKFACAVKERDMRSLGLVNRIYIHSTYYLDKNAYTGTLTGTSFNIYNNVLTGYDSFFVSELMLGDYIKIPNNDYIFSINEIISDSEASLNGVYTESTTSNTITYNRTSINNGSSTSLAFCSPLQFINDIVKSNGDVLKIRANQVFFDQVEGIEDHVKIIGCSVLDDPFNDISDIRPSILHVYIDNCDFESHNVNFGDISIYNSSVIVDNCDITSMISSENSSVSLSSCSFIEPGEGASVYIAQSDFNIIDSDITANNDFNLIISYSTCCISNCNLDNAFTANMLIMVSDVYLRNTITSFTEYYDYSYDEEIGYTFAIINTNGAV
jgi:hypothetical protein